MSAKPVRSSQCDDRYVLPIIWLGLDVDSAGYVYLSSDGGDTLAEKLTPTGEFVATITKPETPPFDPNIRSVGIAVSDQNTVYLTTNDPNHVVVFTSDN